MVIFLADDLGWADVGYHGSEIRTPRIDRLRDGGLELDAFYVQHMCTPTRAALLTGRYPMRYGLQTGVLRPWSEDGLDVSETLLPEMLREAGYATHLVGKWHLGFVEPEMLPTRRGFDHAYGLYTGRLDSFTRERLGGLDWHRDGEPLREEGYTTHLLRDEAVRIVEAHDPGRPLFLYLAFSAPHFPLQAPADEIAAYASIADEDRRTYAAMVTCMDGAIGDVLAALEAKGMREDTLAVFLSDNGASLEHGGSNAPLQGGKHSLQEGGVRVPALVSWPGVIRPGVVDTPMHAVDWAPTILRLAGLTTERERPLDGVDLAPVLFGAGELPRDDLLLIVTPVRGAMRSGPWKLHVGFRQRAAADLELDPVAGVELFRVSDDPTESRNLAATELEVSTRLVERLQSWRNRMVPRRESRQEELPEGYEVPAVWGPRRR